MARIFQQKKLQFDVVVRADLMGEKLRKVDFQSSRV